MPTTTGLLEEVLMKQTKQGKPFWEVIVQGHEPFTTFRREVAEAARDLKTRQVAVDYTEKQNGNFTNRYADAVTAAQQTFAVEGDQREIRIMRQTASKIAAQTLPHLDPSEQTPEGMVQIAEFWVSYYVNGPGVGAEDAEPGPIPDDGIPF